MSSREAILEAVRRSRPVPVPLPDVPVFEAPGVDLAARFGAVIREIGGHAREVDAGGVAGAVAERYPDAVAVASTAPEYGAGSVRPGEVEAPHALAALDVFVCRGTLGVAENGAIWLPASQLVHRAAPFLAQHLVIVLPRADLVWNMHEAYARVRVDEEGFGVFIAGPSKTADIEQSLVIGAHGARSLTVLLISV